MKGTCLQLYRNTDEQNSCEFHRVRKLIKVQSYKRLLNSNFEILYR